MTTRTITTIKLLNGHISIVFVQRPLGKLAVEQQAVQRVSLQSAQSSKAAVHAGEGHEAVAGLHAGGL